ncbi:hypothetical protein [Soonwooa sp.]|uniref:hypothetical protein n=1 Tax=Soonwooa sp. TaxID=1938592 RepID=UPI0028AD0810|nr:hypothetical protein [Soonwooa sp.]
MAKDQEKKLAKESYIHHNKSDEEIAHKYKVSLRTAQRWIKEGNWKKLRDSKANGSEQRIERTQLVVDSMVEERLTILKAVAELQKQKEWDSPPTRDAQASLDAQIAQLRKQAASIDDAISKWNKRIENLNKEGKLTLSLYMEVMERIFEAMRLSNEPLYMQTLDFQENHLEDVASKLF